MNLLSNAITDAGAVFGDTITVTQTLDYSQSDGAGGFIGYSGSAVFTYNRINLKDIVARPNLILAGEPDFGFSDALTAAFNARAQTAITGEPPVGPGAFLAVRSAYLGMPGWRVLIYAAPILIGPFLITLTPASGPPSSFPGDASNDLSMTCAEIAPGRVNGPFVGSWSPDEDPTVHPPSALNVGAQFGSINFGGTLPISPIAPMAGQTFVFPTVSGCSVTVAF